MIDGTPHVAPGVEATARAAFPGLERPAGADLLVISRQIGRAPAGEVFIAMRCPRGTPQVVLTPPSLSGDVSPPLLWLCCPELSRMAGTLESRGDVARYRGILGRDEAARLAFMREEEEFSRIYSRIAHAAGGEELEQLLGARGAAGGKPGAVKCLHAHLAWRLVSGGGTLGGWCLDELCEGEWRGCEKPREACLD